jgi:hypothetical protein
MLSSDVIGSEKPNKYFFDKLTDVNTLFMYEWLLIHKK